MTPSFNSDWLVFMLTLPRDQAIALFDDFFDAPEYRQRFLNMLTLVEKVAHYPG